MSGERLEEVPHAPQAGQRLIVMARQIEALGHEARGPGGLTR